MKVLKLLLRVLGWLLTPLVAWAASFVGAAIGAVFARSITSPTTGLVVTAACGAVAGLGTLALVIHYLRNSPRLRHALHVTAAFAFCFDLPVSWQSAAAVLRLRMGANHRVMVRRHATELARISVDAPGIVLS